MTAQPWAALDLLLVVVGTAGFFGAAALTMSARGSTTGRVAAVACAGLGFFAVLARIVVVGLLARQGWWFVADRVLLALPLAVLTAIVGAVTAGPVLVRAGECGDVRRASAGLFIAGYGSAAGLLVTYLVGYPVDLVPAVVIGSLVAGVAGLTWLGLSGRRRPGLTTGLIVLALVPALAAAGWAFYRHLQPVMVGAAGNGHHVAEAATAGDGPDPAVSSVVSVADLRTGAEPNRPVRRFTLTARQQSVTLPSGAVVDAWTFGSLPGPEIRVRQGDLIEVTLANTDIADGVTLHWHGYRVPNGEDGVAGVTQDAVPPGGSFTYRFVADDPGTYWYHAHQVSSEAVQRGLFGVLIVDPVENGPAQASAVDLVVPVHTFAGIPVVGDTDRMIIRTVPSGSPVRVRLLNTDPTPHRLSVSGVPVTVSAVDGTELNAPRPVSDQVLRIPAGGRYDVLFDMPDGSVGFGLEGAPATGLLVVPTVTAADGAVPFVDGPDLDLLGYGEPMAGNGLSGANVSTEATLVLDRQFRFLAGVPMLAQTVNGEVYPFVPAIAVREGDVLRLTVVNRSGETHPMHPHGHRVQVESRNGEPVRGSPLWLDTFDVQPGEVWTVLLRADNPGIWMAHCHNLEHATQGMVVHLTYQDVSTPYSPGGGPAGNRPE
ncbi:multicopper oxidase family protein [Nakamurella sp.]|uniref:multicopper oxidase family protein n=1 Tax=Nakamurella sp. TaxID=1869182 RepID=UPI003784D3C5